MTALNIAGHVSLFSFMFQQVLLEVTGVAVGALTYVTLVQAPSSSGV